MNKYTTLILFVISLSANLSAQQSAIYTNDLVLYNQALELYNNKQFLAAQNLFDKVRDAVDDENIDADCTYYIANCAVWLNQKGADQLMEDFVVQYPTSIKRNAAYLDVANYYFDNGKYAYARKWYEKVDEGNMGRSEKEKFNFNNGYAYFKIQRFNEAKKFLNKVQESDKYGAKAKYYLGFIAYEGDNYQEATKLFDEVKDLDQYNKNLSYFQSDMNFKAGKFQEAIDEGLGQLSRSKPSEKSELNKIIGESYFNLGQYEKAIPYLKGYRGRKGKWNNTDYYQLGYAFYKGGDYTNAISEFNKIVDGRNATAQNAYYHLAESYLNTDQKQQALNAFKNASEMDFEPKIKEDALYNYAKLSYEIGNSYETAPKVLLSYLDKYPNSEYREEIRELLISSYITSKNYKEAMDLLESSRNFQDKVVYQKVAFYRGIELYNENNYPEAIQYFDKSLNEQRDPIFTARAIYWKAESDYLQNNYDDALIGFKQFKGSSDAANTVEYEKIDYHIGYTYFKLKQYTQAADFFGTFSKKRGVDEVSLTDAYLRLGDSYFISRNYWPAMESYNKAIKNGGPDSDYAHYQKAISYGFVNKNNKKINDLELFIKQYTHSTYRDDAMFALGDTYIAQDKIRSGISAYDRLIKEIPRSSYVPKALLKQGLIYYNGDEGNRALSKFKKVVADYPGTEEAVQAVNTARLIYVDLGRTDEYANWVKGLSFVDVSDADLDNTSYEAAEKQFLENNDSGAISGFEKYLSEFPNGIHALKSHFQLAQLYFKKGNRDASIPHYEYVLQQDRTEFTEQALARLSQVHLENRAYEKAIPVLERLEKDADFPQNIIFAQSNLMKSFYQLINYQKTIDYAEKVLANPKIQNDVKSDAQIFIARAALQTADEVRAKKAYAEVQKIATGELAAEALYYNAYFKHRSSDYKASNQTIQKLAKDYSGYKLYGAKGLVLMAKNFYGLKDAYQATYILESVIKNFSDYPDVIDEARAELKKIKAEEAKTNSSIQTEQ
ncbi:tetratricopeptide repeat protein [Aquimarina sp. 2201CG5-10]|uniref:tetratricopeptide repeat protein n=1 Tax=Aquimarina callyspongiae TaxID=3098150 RepID=UPI002AB56900|nr:tetratricopeptide repeat protein [Aquimarina sp. 2201CG5-10]MDY8138550.1 tetratricopeptide repeat protein [Aquimarina sp. 2201CG5-10]